MKGVILVFITALSIAFGEEKENSPFRITPELNFGMFRSTRISNGFEEGSLLFGSSMGVKINYKYFTIGIGRFYIKEICFLCCIDPIEKLTSNYLISGIKFDYEQVRFQLLSGISHFKTTLRGEEIPDYSWFSSYCTEYERLEYQGYGIPLEINLVFLINKDIHVGIHFQGNINHNNSTFMPLISVTQDF